MRAIVDRGETRCRGAARLALLTTFLAVFCIAIANADDGDAFLRDYAATFRYTLGHPSGFRVTRDGDAVLYVRSGPRSFVRDLFELDTTTGQERKLASAEQLLAGGSEKLSVEELARRERMRVAARGIASFELNHDGSQVLVPLSGTLYVLQRATGQVREYRSDAGFPVDAQFSPTGKAIACVRNGNLHVIELASGNERPLTTDASATLSHGTAEFVAQEEMNRMHGYWWSPDGRRIACLGDGSVWTVDVTSGESRRLTPRVADASGPRPEACVYSPDGRRIAFMRHLPATARAGESWAFNQIVIVDATE